MNKFSDFVLRRSGDRPADQQGTSARNGCCVRISRLHVAGSLALLSVVWMSGCGGQKLYPVQGKIVYTDGTPAKDLEGYTVALESIDQAATAEKAGVSGWGRVQADATFHISTYREGDGAVPGRHRVAITPEVQLSDGSVAKPIIPPRYTRFETSGLEVEIKPTSSNEITLTIERQ